MLHRASGDFDTSVYKLKQFLGEFKKNSSFTLNAPLAVLFHNLTLYSTTILNACTVYIHTV